jgi:hypothetical protein
MQIEVRDGSRTLWVEEFGCYLENGELAFSYYGMPEQPVPEWYGFPVNSVLREDRRSKNPEHPSEELRSARSNGTDVLAFYKDKVAHGGLFVFENPVVNHALQMTDLTRLEPGFYAEGEGYRLCLDVYEHSGLAFWRVKHGPEAAAWLSEQVRTSLFDLRSRRRPKDHTSKP